uniref:Uncharacterized protein n=1 Tax=Arundo donax TaxID=35708 RepID=A0A0A9GBP7_ARUDO
MLTSGMSESRFHMILRWAFSRISNRGNAVNHRPWRSISNPHWLLCFSFLFMTNTPVFCLPNFPAVISKCRFKLHGAGCACGSVVIETESRLAVCSCHSVWYKSLFWPSFNLVGICFSDSTTSFRCYSFLVW